MNFWIVDTFTEKPFLGNPATVFFLQTLDFDEWMQKVALEMNAPETVFISPGEEGHFNIRWFTPKQELKISGHGTLAAAHVLWKEKNHPIDSPIYFDNKNGIFKVENENEEITLDLQGQYVQRTSVPEDLLEALKTSPVYVGKSQDIYLVELRSPQDVIDLCPDYAQLSRLDADGVIVTASCSNNEYDFVSRLFEPKLGFAEDVVSASSYSILVPYWNRRLGRNEFLARHVTPREGLIKARYSSERVYVTGKALTICEGRLHEKAFPIHFRKENL